MKAVLIDLLAVAAVVYAVSLVFTSNFNMGNLLVWIMAAMLGGYALWQKPLDLWFSHGAGLVCRWVLAAGGLFLVGMLCFVAVSGYTNQAAGNEKVVIVLGAGLRKDRPSSLLRCRLDAAYDYAVEHGDCTVITTGGQGMGETVPEGQAMRDYLIGRGLSPDRVLAETKSTSTEENFLFAQNLIDQYGLNSGEPIVYVTNAFHCYRAGRYAERTGFAGARALPAGIPLRSIPTCYLREVFAVLYYWVFKTSQSGPMQAMVGLLDLNKKFFYK